MADRHSLPSLITPFWGAAFLLTVALLLGAGGIAVWQYLRFADATERVERAHSVLTAIDNLGSRISEAETGHRGYLLTHDSRFLQPYEQVTTDARRLSDTLRILVADDPQQRERAAELEELIAARLDEMVRVLAIDRAQGAENAVARLAAGRGRELMEEIRAAARQMSVAERSGWRRAAPKPIWPARRRWGLRSSASCWRAAWVSWAGRWCTASRRAAPSCRAS